MFYSVSTAGHLQTSDRWPAARLKQGREKKTSLQPPILKLWGTEGERWRGRGGWCKHCSHQLLRGEARWLAHRSVQSHLQVVIPARRKGIKEVLISVMDILYVSTLQSIPEAQHFFSSHVFASVVASFWLNLHDVKGQKRKDLKSKFSGCRAVRLCGNIGFFKINICQNLLLSLI